MSSGRTAVRPRILITIFLLMAGEWILLVAGVKGHEMLVGLASVLAAAVFLRLVLQTERLQTDFRLRDVCAVWRVPGYILTNTWTLCDVLLKDLLKLQAAGSYYRVSGFRTSRTDPELIARRVLATVYTTVSPNSIVIGIDYEQSRMLLHQVKRDEVSTMTKQLGGQP